MNSNIFGEAYTNFRGNTCNILEYRRKYLYLCKYLCHGRKNFNIKEIQLLGGEFN